MSSTGSAPPFNGLDLRTLSTDDIGAAQALVENAGWNQVEEDWTFMINNGHAIGLFDGTTLIATALVLPHGKRFAWISMVLVNKAWQRKGLATGLLRHCIDEISNKGQVPVLDATEAGRPVYQPLGFKDIYSLSRLRTSRPRNKNRAIAETEEWTIQPIAEVHLAPLIAWDGERFGAERACLIRTLWYRSQNFARIAIAVDGAIAGYLLGRNGRRATHIGPVIATSEEIAISLMRSALDTIDGPQIIDLTDDKYDLRDWLENQGYQRERGFTRMALGRAQPFDRPSEMFAIAGPELG